MFPVPPVLLKVGQFLLSLLIRKGAKEAEKAVEELVKDEERKG